MAAFLHDRKDSKNMHKNSGKTLTRLPDDGTLFLCNRKKL